MKLITIGSSQDVHVRLNSQYVSGYHAEILVLDNGDIILTDKASKNGTFLNGTRIAPNKEVTVRRGDNIKFADVNLNWNSIPILMVAPDVKEVRGIGTNFRNRYILQGDKVSRFHATLKQKKNGKWYIQDHSKNGTTVNGMKIPKDQEMEIKKGDKILCAGVEVPNPIPQGGGLLKWGIIGAAVAAVIAVAVVIAPKIITSFVLPDSDPVEMTDVELYNKYKDAIVYIQGYYFYKISAGSLDLESFDMPTEVIYVNEKNFKGLKPVDGKIENMYGFTGTGFFVSEDGKIATNLHIAKPWLTETEITTLIADSYKQMLSIYATIDPQVNAFVSQIKVEGVMGYIGFYPNEVFPTADNLIRCREIAAGDNLEEDVAILQSTKNRLPEGVNVFVDLNSSVVADKDIHVGEHIYTMGFPFGSGAQSHSNTDVIKLLARGGSITQDIDKYSFGFDAASFGGASGSPIFNSKGQLVGVLNRGISISQGFNYAIKASYAKDLFDKTLREH